MMFAQLKQFRGLTFAAAAARTLLLILTFAGAAAGREFLCAGGDIACLFNSMTEAKFNGEANTIFLQNGTYRGMQLPSISSSFPLTIVGQNPDQTIISGAGQSLSNVFFVASGGQLYLERITVSGATAGGLRNDGTLELTNVIVRSNSSFLAGAGVMNSGTAAIFNSTVAFNNSIDSFGGGIHNTGAMGITDSTIANNTAGGAITSGNGIQNAGALKIVNTTIAKNTRPGEVRGGGIDNTGTLDIVSSTIAENRGTSGGGIANVDPATTILRNTILAGNIGLAQGTSQVFEPGGPDCAGTLISLGNNLIGDTSNCAIVLQSSDLTGNPRLGTFTENASIPGSGHYPVLAGSPAVDAADPANCPETDQLDVARAGNCDIGAIEFPGASGQRVVTIKITPASAAKNINPGRKKTIDVAILSAADVDAGSVSTDSLRFGVTGSEAAPKKFTQKDANQDRARDLVLRFEIPDLGIQCGDTSLILTGQFTDGQSFTSGTSITTKCKGK